MKSLELNQKPVKTEIDPELPSQDPKVSFDIALGKSLKPNEVVDVDMQALRDTLDRLDAPEKNDHLSIVLTDPSNMPTGVSGSYQPGDDHIVVRYNQDEKAMQKTTQHELGHYVDFTNDPLTKSDVIKNTIGQTSLKAVMFNSPAVISTSALSLAGQLDIGKESLSSSFMNSSTYDAITEIMGYAQLGSTALAVGAAALSGIFYYGHRREKTARRAEKHNLATIFTVK